MEEQNIAASIAETAAIVGAAPPAPTKEPIRLTRDQAKAWLNRIKLKHCYVGQSGYGASYWRQPLGTGRTNDKALAIRDTVANNLAISNSSGSVWFELVDQDLAEKLLKLKCCAEHVLGTQLVKMLEKAPLNPTLRSHVMAVTGQMPAAELDTAEKITNWIEETFDPNNAPGEITWDQIDPPPNRPTLGTPTLHIPISFSEDVSGTCRYHGTNYGSGQVNVSDDIREYLDGLSEDEPPNLDRLVDYITDTVVDEAVGRCDPDMELSYEDVEYRDHEDSDSQGISVEMDFSRDRMRLAIINYLQVHLPDVARRMNL